MQEPKVSIISILPIEIRDTKPNLYPGNFIIPAGTRAKPGILTIGNSRFYVPMAFGAAPLPVQSYCLEVANSVVNDWIGALIEVTPECRPGIFVAPKQFNSTQQVLAELATELIKAEEAQRQWFMRLVNEADHEFSKHNQARSISDLQKIAGRELNLQNKPWLMTVDQLSVNNCPACFKPVNTNAVICGDCRYILKPDIYENMKFAEIRSNPTPEQKAG
jgi:hypothetical protein